MKVHYSTTKIMFRGLMVVLPMAVIGSLVYWLMHSLESGLARLLTSIIHPDFYFPGMGLAFGVFLIYLVGLLVNQQPARRLFDWWEHLLKRIPFVKSLYGGVQDIMQFFSNERKRRFNKVVAVTLKEPRMRLVGFVTQESLASMPEGTGPSDSIIVYLPMSYQIGGYMVLVARADVQPINMSIEDATRFIFTAGMSVEKREDGLVVEKEIPETL